MTIIRSPWAMQRFASRWRRQGHTIGFVPTMGALHAGHLALIRRARRQTDRVIVSLFVNPLQFDQRRDYTAYPRSLAHDAALARAAGTDALFVPSTASFYPSDFQTTVEVTALSRRWEGASRPGHFRGVTTVVAKLLNLVQPTVLYLGEKDAQQARVLQQLVHDLAWETAVRVVPTVREPDGLAMSSRNIRLSPSERQAALVVFGALQAARRLIESGTRRRAAILRRVRAELRRAPRVALDYVAVVDPTTLEPVEHVRGPVRVLVAVRIGDVRLIDTLLIQSFR